ncbi:MAG TPA: lysophospholipid acyltransferase family protein [Motilibacteraceae bacterium]|nr:lysophospholipid acyltransferase family protein [Motilibacteraceae bacterium]
MTRWRSGAGRDAGRPRAGFWYRFAIYVLKPLLTVFTRRDWHGAENLPRTGGMVLVANHISHLDALTLAHFLYDNGLLPRFLAKAAVFDVPFVGRVVRGAEQIPVYRESQDAALAYEAAVAAVRRGECVVVYPEATLTRDPDLWPMRGKTGAARIALATGAPVVPVAQWGVQEVLAPYSNRPHLLPPRTVHVLAAPPVDLSGLPDGEPTAEVLAEATDRIMAALTAAVAQLRGQTPPAVRFDPKAAGVPVTGNPHRQQGGASTAPRRRRSHHRGGRS